MYSQRRRIFGHYETNQRLLDVLNSVDIYNFIRNQLLQKDIDIDCNFLKYI